MHKVHTGNKHRIFVVVEAVPGGVGLADWRPGAAEVIGVGHLGDRLPGVAGALGRAGWRPVAAEVMGAVDVGQPVLPGAEGLVDWPRRVAEDFGTVRYRG